MMGTRWPDTRQEVLVLVGLVRKEFDLILIPLLELIFFIRFESTDQQHPGPDEVHENVHLIIANRSMRYSTIWVIFVSSPTDQVDPLLCVPRDLS